MYVPGSNAVDEVAAREMVSAYAAGELITVGTDGYPLATLLPVLWEGDRVIAHMARANPQWRTIAPDSPALLVVGGPQAYVTPSWYAAKAEHGRVVPTWNYSSVHLTGRLTVIEDADWLRDAVTALTDRHEAARAEPWAVTDAPSPFIDGMLKAIVGLELQVEKVEAKAKLSQNRSLADREGVIAGLGDHPVARQMRDLL
ncbi:FMN-binding negative transcriptional regulator [Nocardioides montaniterrae]